MRERAFDLALEVALAARVFDESEVDRATDAVAAAGAEADSARGWPPSLCRLLVMREWSLDALERCRRFAEVPFTVGTVSFAEAAVVLAEAVHTLCCNSRRLSEIWTQSRLLIEQLER